MTQASVLDDCPPRPSLSPGGPPSRQGPQAPCPPVPATGVSGWHPSRAGVGVADVEYLFLKGWRKVTFPTSSLSHTVLSCGLRAGDGPSDGTVLPPFLRPCAPFIKLLSSPQLSLHLLFVLLGLTCAQLRPGAAEKPPRSTGQGPVLHALLLHGPVPRGACVSRGHPCGPRSCPCRTQVWKGSLHQQDSSQIMQTPLLSVFRKERHPGRKGRREDTLSSRPPSSRGFLQQLKGKSLSACLSCAQRREVTLVLLS